jgi:hypothetical protein
MEQKSIPADVLNVIPSEPARILLLEGETHLLSEPIVARSKCEITFDNEAQLQACVQAIKESGEQTKLKIESGERPAYTWDRTFREGMTIIFSVAWHDRDFFDSRKEAWKSKVHASIFDRFGVSPTNFTIEHEISANN